MGPFTSGARAAISEILRGECDGQTVVPRNLNGSFTVKPLDAVWGH